VGTLQDKVVILTGASSGIGRATAIGLAHEGAQLLLVGRTPKRCNDTLATLRASGANNPQMLEADFSRLNAVRKLVDELGKRTSKIDILINNAATVSASRQLTPDGYEMTFAVNHLSPFLLTGLLLPLLGEGARVINVASEAHRWGSLDLDDLHNKRRYGAMRVYGQSKSANILWNQELARRLTGSGVTANSLHPGAISTNLGRGNGFTFDLLQRFVGLFMKSPKRGAKSSIYLATAQDVEGVSGRYFDNCREREPADHATDPATAKRLWELSEELVGFHYL
jgi:NAD(P)-dependent dehydrogenase (short-subunit alcohol dehydrogenase family)